MRSQTRLMYFVHWIEPLPPDLWARYIRIVGLQDKRFLLVKFASELAAIDNERRRKCLCDLYGDLHRRFTPKCWKVFIQHRLEHVGLDVPPSSPEIRELAYDIRSWLTDDEITLIKNGSDNFVRSGDREHPLSSFSKAVLFHQVRTFLDEERKEHEHGRRDRDERSN